jgi:hypothetical protein
MLTFIVVDAEQHLMRRGGRMGWTLAARNCVWRPIVGHECNGIVTCELSLSLNIDVERVSVSDFSIR